MNRAPRPARRRVLLALVAFGALSALAAPAASQSGAGAPDLRLTAASHGVSVKAKLFTYCNTVVQPDGTGTGLCADGIPGPTSTRLPVHRRGSVTITTDARVGSVFARYADVGAAPSSATLRVRALDTSGRRFSVSLPDARPRSLLLVSLAYGDLPRPDGGRESGDAHFSVGLREHRHPKAKRKPTPIAVTTRAQASCDVTDLGGQSCRINQEGTVRRRPGTKADCRGGRVRIRVLAQNRHVVTSTVRTTTGCRYRLQDRAFALEADTAAITVQTRFLGSDSLAARSAPTNRIDLTP
ncbi:MAG: hypothetical protein Q8K79_19385 [Solirubrobacteraceae bacterium]|nr:hypothetical protein [Solirubrobacteraceae bacterium]